MAVRILIADDHGVLRAALRGLVQDMQMTVANAQAIEEASRSADEARKAVVAAARRRLVRMRVLADDPGFTLRPMAGTGAAPETGAVGGAAGDSRARPPSPHVDPAAAVRAPNGGVPRSVGLRSHVQRAEPGPSRRRPCGALATT